jgi:hypothetical protein
MTNRRATLRIVGEAWYENGVTTENHPAAGSSNLQAGGRRFDPVTAHQYSCGFPSLHGLV